MAAPTTLPVDATCVHQAPGRHESARRMGWVLGITAVVMVAEVVGGLASHSLALLADAGHMLADVAALGLAVVVARLAQRPATAERTFGLLRLEIFAPSGIQKSQPSFKALYTCDHRFSIGN